MARYDPKERIGVNATENIVLNDFEWIFREQPIVDVGIDALVEQCTNGNPTGKFVAMQIKTGEGNFSISKDKLTYYVSNIHYKYWSNFDMPLLLIAHLPKSGSTHWIEITKKNLKRTGKRWKLEIPKKNLFNRASKIKLSKLLTTKGSQIEIIKIFMGEAIDNGTIYHHLERLKCLSDANHSMSLGTSYLNNLTEKINGTREAIDSFNDNPTYHNISQVKANFSTLAKSMNIFSKRMETESEIFSETFAESFFGFEQLIMIYSSLSNDFDALKDLYDQLISLPKNAEKAIHGFTFLKESVENLSKVDLPELAKANKNMISILDLWLFEFDSAIETVQRMSHSVENVLNSK